MGTFSATFRVTASGLLGPAAWGTLGSSFAIVLVLCALQVGLTPEQSWLTRSTLFALLFWLPGLWVALRLRDAWPALGPGDEAAAWLANQGHPLLPIRAGAIAGAVAALVALQISVGVAVGVAGAAFDGCPTFRETIELRAMDEPTVLARTGQYERFALPPLPHGGTLRLEPRYYFSMLRLRGVVELEVSTTEPGGTHSVAVPRLHDFGAAVEAELPPLAAAGLRIQRKGGDGSPVSFAAGRVAVRAQAVVMPVAGALLAGGHLPWALTLLAAAIAFSQILHAGVQILVLLGTAPLLGLLPHLAKTSIATRLANGELPPVGAPSAALCVTLAAAVAIGVLPKRHAGRPRSSD